MLRAPHDWTDTERGLWDAFRRGEVYDLRSGDSAQDWAPGDAVWGPERTIRAEVIARLLLNCPEPAPGRVAGLKLTGALITGELLLAGATIQHYVELRHCRFEQRLLLSEARANTLRFISCLIPRIDASRLSTTGDLHLARCVVPTGIRLTDAKIGTDLLLNQAVILGDEYGRALAADGISVHQDFEAERIHSYGEISLRTGRVGGRLSLRGAELHASAPERNCLNLARITIENTLYLSGSIDANWINHSTIYAYSYDEAPPPEAPSTPFRAYGGVRLVDGRFGNACLIANAEINLTGTQELSLRRIQTPELRFTCRIPPTGSVSLSRARIGNLVDRPSSWPSRGTHVGLNGFTYESLRPEEPFSVQQRIEWLDGALDEFQPEPYEQLAAALRRDGSDDDAREVLYAKQRRRRCTLPMLGRIWGRLQDITVGYGYRPGRAAGWLALIWAFGTGYFAAHRPEPLKHDEVPTWNPALFALSKVLPVVELGQEGWNPDRHGQYVATALVISGWLLATTVVAGATRLLQRG